MILQFLGPVFSKWSSKVSNLRSALRAHMIGLSPFQIWCRSLPQLRDLLSTKSPPSVEKRVKKIAKSSITQAWPVRFCSYLVQSLSARHKIYKYSRSSGQKSRSQGEKRLIAKLMLSFRKLGWLNSIVMSEFLSEAGKYCNSLCTVGLQIWPKLPRTTCTTSCDLQVAMPRFLAVYHVCWMKSARERERERR